MAHSQQSSPAVVVSGASSGIGRALALALEGAGYTVFAGVRRPKDGEGLRGEGEGRITPVVVDLTDEPSIERAGEKIGDLIPEDKGLFGLVNNAGLSLNAPLEVLELEEFRRQMEVNLTGQLSLTRTLLGLLRTRGEGRIINMGSVLGRLPFPFTGPYSASKAALAAMSDSLRMELKPQGIRVTLIEAGAIQTPIWDKYLHRAEALLEDLSSQQRALYERGIRASMKLADSQKESGAPVEAVTGAVLRALTTPRPKGRYLVGWDARAGYVMEKVLPQGVLDGLILRRYS